MRRDTPCVLRDGEPPPAKGTVAAGHAQRSSHWRTFAREGQRCSLRRSVSNHLYPEPLTPDSTKTAVFLSFGRKREKVGRKEKESPRTAKASTASAPAARKSAVLFRLPRQKASTRHADRSALHMHQPCSVSNAAGISLKMHVPVMCFAMPCGEGNHAVVLSGLYKPFSKPEA